MLHKKQILVLSLVLGMCCLCAASQAQADAVFTVSLDTSQLSVLHPGASFALDFQLNDGSGTLDGNNTATLSNFWLGGGSASGIPDLFGGVSGSLSTTVSIIDSSFLNEFTQAFIPGALLSFDVNLTTNVDAGPFPDQFTFSMTEPAVFSFFDVFVQVDIDSTNPIVQALPVTNNRITLTPVVRSAQPVPEPMTLLLLVLGLAGIALTRSRKPAKEWHSPAR